MKGQVDRTNRETMQLCHEIQQSYINLCPHDIVLSLEDITFEFKTTRCLRLVEKEGNVLPNEYELVPVLSPPEYIGLNFTPEPGSRIIVSQLVAQYLKEHQETFKLGAVYAPDTGPRGAVRDDKGQIIGTKRLIKFL